MRGRGRGGTNSESWKFFSESFNEVNPGIRMISAEFNNSATMSHWKFNNEDTGGMSSRPEGIRKKKGPQQGLIVKKTTKDSPIEVERENVSPQSYQSPLTAVAPVARFESLENSMHLHVSTTSITHSTEAESPRPPRSSIAIRELLNDVDIEPNAEFTTHNNRKST
ncbi:cysteine tRS [Acrasis kona]|uniref:Cysteine tRS n=1 Tax=Acrasis kona TaxID=1008807 RepID=A0AAW2ZM08_9EUKA